MGTKGWVVAALGVAALAGCSGASPRSYQGVGQPPTVGQGPIGNVPPGPMATAPPSTVRACDFWRGAFGLTVRSNAGRGDFFREYRYDFRAGQVAVVDSDPFATGPETKVPRVVQRSRVLAPAERARVEQSLFSSCPSAVDLKRSCAPGGCLRLEVQGGGGPPSLDDCDTARQALRTFDSLFPELRSQ